MPLASIVGAPSGNGRAAQRKTINSPVCRDVIKGRACGSSDILNSVDRATAGREVGAVELGDALLGGGGVIDSDGAAAAA